MSPYLHLDRPRYRAPSQRGVCPQDGLARGRQPFCESTKWSGLIRYAWAVERGVGHVQACRYAAWSRVTPRSARATVSKREPWAQAVWSLVCLVRRSFRRLLSREYSTTGYSSSSLSPRCASSTISTSTAPFPLGGVYHVALRLPEKLGMALVPAARTCEWISHVPPR